MRADGTVVATGNNEYGQCDVSEWNDIVAISAGPTFTIGLRKDGSLIFTGKMTESMEQDMRDWQNIKQISLPCGGAETFVVGLKYDGTIVYSGAYSDVFVPEISQWSDIEEVETGFCHIVGRKSDGTVVTTEYNSYEKFPVQEARQWSDIIDIAAGLTYTLGVKCDGTVVYAGELNDGEDVVLDWEDIEKISVVPRVNIVGYKKDGTLISADPELSKLLENEWKDVDYIGEGYDFVRPSYNIGIKADGTVVATGNNDDGECNVSDW